MWGVPGFVHFFSLSPNDIASFVSMTDTSLSQEIPCLCPVDPYPKHLCDASVRPSRIVVPCFLQFRSPEYA